MRRDMIGLSIKETTKLLISWLNRLEMDFDDKKAVILMLENEKMELKMLEWFLNNQNPTQKQVMEQARKIAIKDLY